MAQSRTKGGKFAQKETYKCPNCGNTQYVNVHGTNGLPIQSQQRCTECGHVLTTK